MCADRSKLEASRTGQGHKHKGKESRTKSAVLTARAGAAFARRLTALPSVTMAESLISCSACVVTRGKNGL
jgi:hypothetical protein